MNKKSMFHWLRTCMRSAYARIVLLLLIISLVAGWSACTMFSMPGSSYDGTAPALDEQQENRRDRLERHVRTLAGDIGVRNVFHPGQLERARNYIVEQWTGMGYEPTPRTYTVRNETVANLEVERTGTTHPDEIILIGAHYDTVSSPGADDNASGVAALLELARAFRDRSPQRTLRFVAFVNEEPPFYRTEGEMGSWVYARRAREEGENIRAMISLEMLGYYQDEDGSQNYPFPLSLLYPSRGDFIGFVGNYSNRQLLRRCLGTFREHATIPSEGGAPPGWISGVGWSDHWSFWQEGYPGIMVTDTAVFRNPHYHAPTDRPDTLDYTAMTRVVDGLEPVLTELAGPPDD